MRVLLCSPYNVGPDYVQGGIVVWTQNIFDYYLSLSTDVQLQVAPFDRKAREHALDEGNLLKRAWFGITEYSGAIKNTHKLLSKGNYDVLHLCTSASISLLKDLIVLKMASRKRVKTVVHFHFGRIPDLERKGNWEWRLLQRVSRLADALVTMDMKSFDVMRKHGYSTAHYLPNPLSTSVLHMIETESVLASRQERKLCFVGHIIPTKGVFELIKACRGIEGIKLHVVGKATPEVRRNMEQLSGGGDWLVFEGEVDHEKVIRELLTSSVFVLPTYTEGFPNVILESMACGCSIVTTPVGAIPEMLDIASETPCGLCCEPRDVDGLRKNIQFFLDNPLEARRYAERAKKRVLEMYSIPKIWEQLVGIWGGVFLQ